MLRARSKRSNYTVIYNIYNNNDNITKIKTITAYKPTGTIWFLLAHILPSGFEL